MAAATEVGHFRGRVGGSVVRAGLVFVLFVALLLVAAACSWASSFEQPPAPGGIFGGVLHSPPEGVFPEEVQLGGLGGMAVDVNGVGGPEGVPAGTVYAVGYVQGAVTTEVARYTPNGGGLSFSAAWEVNVPGEPEPYRRCGPEAGEPLRPHCQPRVNAGPSATSVAVDQVTGNVYVLNGAALTSGLPWITEFSPDGSRILARFGDRVTGSTTAETPANIHYTSYLAVDGAGLVYVTDEDITGYRRLMVFKPQSPGDYEHYVYAEGSDIHAVATLQRPVVDDAGNVYVTNETHVWEYAPSQPLSPICDFEHASGGIVALAVNPQTGEPFYYSYKDRELHQLGACEAGKFVESHKFAVTQAANRTDISALAFDPVRKIGSRPAGVLYGGAPEGAESGLGPIGYIFAPAEENPPAIESEGVVKVTSSSAELRALIDPRGFDTRDSFQYLSDSAYVEAGESFSGAVEVPLGGQVLGSGQGALAAAATLSGLAPESEYRYRVIATSHCAPKEPEKVCESVGAVKSLRTFGPDASVIPDGRAYELVSPAWKNVGQVFPANPEVSSCGLVECKPGGALQRFPLQSAPGGDAVVYEGNPFSASGGAVLENEYRAERTGSGWQTTNLSPPTMNSKGGLGYKAFDAQLSKAVLEQKSPALSPQAPPEFTNLYLQPTASPLALAPLITEAPPHRVPATLKLAYAGSSADLSRRFFTANDELGSQGAGGAEAATNLYESSGGELHLVSIGPGSEPIPEAVFGSGTLLKNGNPSIPAQVLSHAISADGTRAFWTGKEGKTYVRVDGTETLEVPGPGSCAESVELPARVCFLTASADGSSVLLSNGQIDTLNNATGAYEAGSDLSQGKGGFQGIAGQSDDLSHVYFVDTAVLAGAEENSGGAKAQPAQNNLYAWHQGTTSFIATLQVPDGRAPYGGVDGEGDWADSPTRRTAQASPNGGWLAFLSRAPLTGQDSTGPCKASSGTGKFVEGPCPEAFLYQDATGDLRCASCSPSGSQPLGPSFLPIISNLPDSGLQPRYLTDSGRLFFDSRDSLVPGDSNGAVEDLYEFEPAGVGSCARKGGCVSLISAGDGSEDSNFLAMDENGENVFFTTRDRLLGADTDTLFDLYDARVAGGFPEPAKAPECVGEACQPQPPPLAESPPAAPASGGNIKPPPPTKPPPPKKHCNKHQVKRGNHCIKKPSHKKHRAKRANHNHRGTR